MSKKTVQEETLASGIRELDKKYSDYLYEIRSLFDLDETPTIGRFISLISHAGQQTVVFLSLKGNTLRGDARRDVIDLYSNVYDLQG